MNESTLMLFVAVSLLSAAVSHAVWCKLRVLRLQRDVAKMRLTLFECAKKCDKLDDVAYLRWDKAINSFADFAEELSLPLWIYSCFTAENSDSNGDSQFPTTGHDELDDFAKRSFAKMYGRLTSYALRETFGGVATVSLLRLVMGAIGAKNMIARATDAFASVGKRGFDNHNPLALR